MHDREGMIIYNRKSAGSGINEVLALTKMERPASRLFAVVSGYPHYPLFMPYVIKSEVLQENENKVWVFQELDFPWPISNRYYTIELTTNKEQSAQGHYLISWTLAQTAQESIASKGVKLERDDGHWLFCTLGENQTFVEYYIHSNPGGILPSWVVNEANTRAVPEVLKAVRQRSMTEVPQGESGR